MFDTMGSGCGTVGRVVTSDTRDQWFESSQRQILFAIDCYKKLYLLKRRKRGREWQH